MVSATRRIPTFFMHVLGRQHLDVASVAEATVPPLDADEIRSDDVYCS
jgi:hypothetical protein